MTPLARYLDQTERTQRWLAQAVGVREATVSAWVNGHATPRPHLIAKIAQVTDGGVPIDVWFAPSPVAAE